MASPKRGTSCHVNRRNRGRCSAPARVVQLGSTWGPRRAPAVGATALPPARSTRPLPHRDRSRPHPSVFGRLRTAHAANMKRFDAIRDNALATAMMSRAVYYSMVKLREDSDLTPVRLVEHWAEQQPNSLALTGPEGSLSYRGLNRRANAAARVFSSHAARAARAGQAASEGGRAGGGVLFVGRGRPGALIVLLGAAKIGACTTLLDARTTRAAFEHALRVTDPDIVVVGDELGAAAAALRAVAAEDRGAGPRAVFRYGLTAGASRGARADREPVDLAVRIAEASGDALADGDAPGLGHDMRRDFVAARRAGAHGAPEVLPFEQSAVHPERLSTSDRPSSRSNPTDVVYAGGVPLAHPVGLTQGWGVALTGGAVFVPHEGVDFATHYWDEMRRRWTPASSSIATPVPERLLDGSPPTRRSARIGSGRCSGLGSRRAGLGTASSSYSQLPLRAGALRRRRGARGPAEPRRPSRHGRARARAEPDALARVDPIREELIYERGKLVPTRPGETGASSSPRSGR